MELLIPLSVAGFVGYQLYEMSKKPPTPPKEVSYRRAVTDVKGSYSSQPSTDSPPTTDDATGLPIVWRTYASGAVQKIFLTGTNVPDKPSETVSST